MDRKAKTGLKLHTGDRSKITGLSFHFQNGYDMKSQKGISHAHAPPPPPHTHTHK